MRRRKPLGSNLPPELTPEALPLWVDDLSKPPRARVRAWEQWVAAFETWRQARHDWAVRRRIDPGTMSEHSELIPDAPFDPSTV